MSASGPLKIWMLLTTERESQVEALSHVVVGQEWPLHQQDDLRMFFETKVFDEH